VTREPVIYTSQGSGGALANSDFDGVIGGEKAGVLRTGAGGLVRVWRILDYILD
jgi:hypothetical protein